MKAEKTAGLGELIRRGGLYRGIRGGSSREALSGLIGALRLPPSVKGEELLRAVLEREALMPTGVGNGVALPHPRNPLVSREEEQFAALGLLEKPVDWNALDGKAVDILILIVSASPKAHLRTLSALNYFCRDPLFVELLRRGAPEEEIIAFVEETERNWGA